MKSIGFKGAMLRAVLDGSKIETRVRVPLPAWNTYHFDRIVDGEAVFRTTVESWDLHTTVATSDFYAFRKCPYGNPGELLCVKEAYNIVPATAYRHSLDVPHKVSPDGYSWAIYREGLERVVESPWKSYVTMPQWASRVTLEIVDTRIERLHDITAEGALDEGMTQSLRAQLGYAPCESQEDFNFNQSRDTFRIYYDSINGNGAWDTNPWVWVARFKKVTV